MKNITKDQMLFSISLLVTVLISLPILTSAQQISCGLYHSLYVCNSGVVWAWGYNELGSLGDGTTTDRTAPVQVSGLTGMIGVGGGAVHSVAVKSDGTVWTWGWNGWGQLGDGTTTDRNTPVQVPGLTGIVAVSGGGNYCLALKNDGTVWAWGQNDNGQLGDGTTVHKSTPVQAIGLTGVIAIAGGSKHSIALKSDGTVWAWGSNAHGQLGDGSSALRRLTPVQVHNVFEIIAVACKSDHVLALKNDGTVWVWGANFFGQLGDQTTMNRVDPIQLSGLGNVVGVGTGFSHSMVLKSDGTVYAWGWNPQGQLGDGTNMDNPVPVQVSGLTGPVILAAGSSHSLALKDDGSLRVWGGNLNGQLGIGSMTPSTIPLPLSIFCASITIGAISSSSLCSGVQVAVSFSATGSYDPSNVFTAQLSDAAGNFTSPVNIGSVASTSSGSINATLPLSTPTGSNYRIRVVGSSPSVIGSEYAGNITVTSLPNVTVSAGGPTSFCPGGSVTLTASGADSYVWSNSQNSPSISVAIAGNYSVVGTDASGCSSTSDIQQVVVYTAPGVTVTSDRTIVFFGSTSPVVTALSCANLSASLTSGSPTNGSYLWSSNPSSPIVNSDASQIFVCPTVNTEYSVVYTTQDGCTATDNISVAAHNVSCGNGGQEKVKVCIATPSGQKNEICVPVQGVSNLLANNPNASVGVCTAFKQTHIFHRDEENIEIFPNPARDYLFIRSANLVGAEIFIYDGQGRVLFRRVIQHLDGDLLRLETAQYGKGILFIKVKTDGKTVREKLMKD